MGRSEETGAIRWLKRDLQQTCTSKPASTAAWDGTAKAGVADATPSPDSKQSKRPKLDLDDRSKDLVSDLLGHQVQVRRRPRSFRKSGAESQGTADGDEQASRSCSTDEEDDKAAAEALLGFSLGTDQMEQVSGLCPLDKPGSPSAIAQEVALQQPALSKPSSPQLPSYIDPEPTLPTMTLDDVNELLNHRLPPTAMRPQAAMPQMAYADMAAVRSTMQHQPVNSVPASMAAVSYPPAPQPPPAQPALGPDTKPVQMGAAAKGTGSTGKSELTVLCEKFQERFGRLHDDGSPREIMLKEVAEELAVPRRRLYDIINVLEAVEIVVRTGKLTYEWRGLSHLPDLLDRLARDEQNGVPVQDRVRRMVHKTVVVQKEGDEASEPQRREHVTRSLWMLSRKFVRLLLTHKEPIPLVEAAAMLIGNEPGSESAVHMTVERRLYDIGSILSSLGLIEKTYLGRNSSSGSKTRQPAFQWKYRYSKMSTRVQPGLQWGQAMDSHLGYPVADPYATLPLQANNMRGAQPKMGAETETDLYMMQSQNLVKQQGYMAGAYGCPGFAVPYGTILMPPAMAAPPHSAAYMLVPSPGMEDGKAYGMVLGQAATGTEAGKEQRAGQAQSGTRGDVTEDWVAAADAAVNGAADSGDAAAGQRGARMQQQQQQQQRMQNSPSPMMMHMPHFMQAPTMMPTMSPHMYGTPMAMPQQGSAVCIPPFGTPMLAPPMYAQGILPNGQPALFPTNMAPMPTMMHTHTATPHGMAPLPSQPNPTPAASNTMSNTMDKTPDPTTATTAPNSVTREDTDTTAADAITPTMVNGGMLYGLGMNMPMMAMPGCVSVCVPHGGYAPNIGVPHAGCLPHSGYTAANK